MKPMHPENNSILNKTLDPLNDISFLQSSAGGAEEGGEMQSKRQSIGYRPVFRESPFGKNTGVPSTFASQIAENVIKGTKKL